MVGDPSAITATARSQEKPMLLILQTGSAAGWVTNTTKTTHRGFELGGRRPDPRVKIWYVVVVMVPVKDESSSLFRNLATLGCVLCILRSGKAYTLGPALRILHIKNVGKNFALEELRICQ